MRILRQAPTGGLLALHTPNYWWATVWRAADRPGGAPRCEYCPHCYKQFPRSSWESNRADVVWHRQGFCALGGQPVFPQAPPGEAEALVWHGLRNRRFICAWRHSLAYRHRRHPAAAAAAAAQYSHTACRQFQQKCAGGRSTRRFFRPQVCQKYGVQRSDGDTQGTEQCDTQCRSSAPCRPLSQAGGRQVPCCSAACAAACCRLHPGAALASVCH